MAQGFEHFDAFTEDMEIIQKLGDNPNSDNNMTAEALKQEFDKGGIKVKKFLNGFVDQLNGFVDKLNDVVETDADPLQGGTMMGNLNMNSFSLYGLNDPEYDDQAASKKYVDSQISSAKTYTDGKHLFATATLPASGWSSSAPYTQTVTVAGVVATDSPHVSPVYSDTTATAIAQQEAWGMVSKAEAAAGSIKFTCFEDKPATSIPIQVEVNR